jgi:F-type H+-transporting ATPase subunit gamma
VCYKCLIGMPEHAKWVVGEIFMENIREIQQRIRSINETMHMTKAMKLISAARLRRARQQLDVALPYFNKVRETIGDILRHSGGVNSKYFDLRHEKQIRKKGYVVIAGDKSLAGGYNYNIYKLVNSELEKNPDALLMVAGDVGRTYFERHNFNVLSEFRYTVHNPTIYRARDMAEDAVEVFRNHELDEIDLIFTQMVNTLNLKPTIMKLLPFELETFLNPGEVTTFDEEEMLYEPSYEAVLDVLIPKYLKGIIYGALVEAFNSEQSARMTTMDSASENAEKIIGRLRNEYNHARQGAITREISEIIGGAEQTNGVD